MIDRIFYYNINSTEYTPPFSDMYDLGEDLMSIGNWLPPIVYDFFAGNDLSQYNNYIGICDVSHVAIAFSDNPGENAHVWRTPQARACYQRNMSISDYLKYYGYGD